MEISLGTAVTGTAGKLGEVHRFVVDAKSGKATDLVVKHGGLIGGSERLVPFGHITSVDGEGVHVGLDEQGFDAMTVFTTKGHNAGDPDYVGPPSMDNEGTYRGDAVLDQMVAAGPVGALGSISKPLGYPGGEQIVPDDLERPVVESGTAIVSDDGDHVGNVGEIAVNSDDGSLMRLTLKQGMIFKHETRLPADWVKEFGSDGILLNVNKHEVEGHAKAQS